MTAEAPALPPGVVEANGKRYMTNASGALVPVELVKAQDLVQDALVRSLLEAATKVEQLLVDFKVNAFAEIDAFNDVLADHYGARAGGKKGNITFTTFDGLVRVQVAVSDMLTFGPELQVAKTLVDHCLEEWSTDSRAEIRALVMDAFDVDKEGNINRGKLFNLLRLESDDERWKKAMQAIRDSIKVIGSKRYIRVAKRLNAQAGWSNVRLDVAA